MSYQNPHLAYRPDIDGLRAIAVMSVVLFHFFPSMIPGGFVGVDIFFVISGYLISSIIFKALARGSFSFSEFYARRVRRIFPSLLIVILTCMVVGWHTLLPDEYAQLAKHSLGGLSFIANFVFWQEAGYFDNAAELKPMLHLWSLGIEEQFYILVPVFIVIAWRFGWRLGLGLATLGILSLMLSILLTQAYPVMSYFLPLTRFWELLAGVCLAFVVHKGWQIQNGANYAAIIGLGLMIAGLVLINNQTNFPGWWALFPVFGTVLLIASGSKSYIGKYFLSNSIMVKIGLISFPLYLWHWPLLSFVKIVYPEKVESLSILIILLVVSFLFAWSSYRFLELPIRAKGGRKTVIALVVSSLLLGLLAMNIYSRDGLMFRMKDSQAKAEAASLEWPDDLKNTQECEQLFNQDELGGPCLVAKKDITPNAIIIGDSHANYFYWALKDILLEENINLLQRAQGACMPVRNTDLLEKGRFLGCPEHTNRAIDYALAHPEIHTVFLAGRWASYISGRELKDWHTGDTNDSEVVIFESGERVLGLDSKMAFKRGFEKTLRELIKADKKIIFLHSVPELDYNARLCLNWAPNRFISRNPPRADCSVSSELTAKRNMEFRPTIEEVLTQFPQVLVMDPIRYMCSEQLCRGREGAILLYRDDDHLSLAGSIWLGEQVKDEVYSLLRDDDNK